MAVILNVHAGCLIAPLCPAFAILSIEADAPGLYKLWMPVAGQVRRI